MLSDRNQQALSRGTAVGKAAEKLPFTPDLILAHPGWGETLALGTGQLWPGVPRLSYLEWYYGVPGTNWDFSDGWFGAARGGANRSSVWSGMARRVLDNLQMLNDASEMVAGVAPTRFQWSVLPYWARAKTCVQHEGIDTAFFAPNASAVVPVRVGGTLRELRAGDEIVTFTTRNYEPYRGVHHFVAALSRVLRARPNAQVLMVGTDTPKTSYGHARRDGIGWLTALERGSAGGSAAQRAAAQSVPWERVHRLGKVTPQVLRAVLQVSAVHVFLSYPFVLSWSMLEAMAAGVVLIGSDTPPVREVVRDGVNGLLVPFDQPDKIGDAIARVLSAPRDRHAAMRAAARATAVEHYSASFLVDAKLALVRTLLSSTEAADARRACGAGATCAQDVKQGTPAGSAAWTGAELDGDATLNRCMARWYRARRAAEVAAAG